MRFLVIGPGAMGCLFSVRLKRAGYDVMLLDYKKDRAEFLNKNGIVLEDDKGSHRERIEVVYGDRIDRVDYAIICVKAYDTERVARSLRGKFKDGIIVTLQNGVGNMELLEEAFGKERVLGGVTSEGATLIEIGRVRHAGRGETVIGPSDRAERDCKRLVQAFQEAGFNARMEEDVLSLIWGKLIINVGINALTALLRVKNGMLLESGFSLNIMRELVNEATLISKKRNIRLPYDNPFDKVCSVCKNTKDNISSMLQDVMKGRKTEIDAINGAIIRAGRELGIHTPFNSMLTFLIHAIEETYGVRV